nr:IS3 family transposase [Nocardiopsis chromatogenes]
MPAPRQQRRRELAEHVRRLHEASNGTSGFRRILACLHAEGVDASQGLVRSIMRELGIFGVQPRSNKRTTVPAPDAHTSPDLLRRDFTAAEPATRLVGDITYLRTGQGWLYLATVIDLHSRMVVGWSMAEHMRTGLVCDALRMAHTHGHVRPGAVFHSDRGSQYTSAGYAAVAGELGGVRLSVGRSGSCHDDAVAESWFSMLNNEMFHRYRFATLAEAGFAVMRYIEVFSNRQRLHSTLGYRTPAAVLALWQEAVALSA